MPGPFDKYTDEDLAKIAQYWQPQAPAPPAPIPPGAFDVPVAPPAAPPAPQRSGELGLGEALVAATQPGGLAKAIDSHYAPAPWEKPPAPPPGNGDAYQQWAVENGVRPAAPPPEMGPTPADNAAFNQRSAEVHAAATAKPAARVGGGAPGNLDPYGTKAAMKGLLGTYDTQADATRRMHAAETDKALFVGERTAELARRREEDASISNMEAQAAAEHFDARMSEVERQLDDVRAKKIDPNRLMRESPGMGLLAVVGGVVGGFYQGLTNGQDNGFLRDLNRMIDRDIAAQERDMDNDRQHFGEKLNLLSQQRAMWKDTQLAKLQTQNLFYEAAKENIAGEAARYDTPIYQARADEAVANIQRAQDELKLKIAQQLQAQSQAAAARQMAQAKEVRDTWRGVHDEAIKQGMPPAMARQVADNALAAMWNGGQGIRPESKVGGADPIANVPKAQQDQAIKEQEKYAAAQRAKSALDDVWAKYEAGPDLPTYTGLDKLDAIKTGGLLQVRNALGEGFSSDKDTQNYVMTNLPRYGESSEARQQKLANVKAFIDSKAATPVLDRHAPGWREATTSEQTKQLGLKPVK